MLIDSRTALRFKLMAASMVAPLARLIEERFNARVSVRDFGAVGDGVADDKAAIQGAIDALGSSGGTIYFPTGDYLIESALKISQTGTILEGESAASTYLRTPNGATFDILKVAGAFSTVKNLQFRPGGNQYCMRVYAAHCSIDSNRFLADVDETGTAILLTDTDPDAGFVAGAYTHTVFNNLIGTDGYAFAIGIDDGSASGITSCKFIANQIISDKPIRISKGGGNTYIGNLLQSSTGTTGTPVGIGIDLGTNVVGEMITGGNYFERFAQATLLRRTVDTAVGAVITGNHYDHNTANIASSGIANYIFEDTSANYRMCYGWQDEATSTTRKFYAPNGTTAQTLDTTGRTTFGRPIGLKAFTVGTLPAGTVGDVAYVSDATAPTYLGALTGGGAIKTPVFYNGSAWVSF